MNDFDKDYVDRVSVRAAQIVHAYSAKNEPGICVSPSGIRCEVIAHLAVLKALGEIPIS